MRSTGVRVELKHSTVAIWLRKRGCSETKVATPVGQKSKKKTFYYIADNVFVHLSVLIVSIIIYTVCIREYIDKNASLSGPTGRPP